MGLNVLLNIQHELCFIAQHRRLPPSACATGFSHCYTTYTLLSCLAPTRSNLQDSGPHSILREKICTRWNPRRVPHKQMGLPVLCVGGIPVQHHQHQTKEVPCGESVTGGSMGEDHKGRVSDRKQMLVAHYTSMWSQLTIMSWGWRDSSEVRGAWFSCRGPKDCSLHPHQVSHNHL